MNIKNNIIVIIFLTVVITGAGYLFMSPKKQNTDYILSNNHTFNNFPHGTIIKTDIINSAGLGYSYPPLNVQKDSEELTQKISKNNLYNNYYEVFYKIQNLKEKTIDVFISVSNNFSVEIKNTKPQSSISITDGSNTLNKNIPTDWAGNIAISNIRANRTICITFKNYMRKAPQICHSMQKDSRYADA